MKCEIKFPSLRNLTEHLRKVYDSDKVRALYRKELDRLITRENGCRPTDRIATLQVLSEPLTPDNGMLTQTMKVRRHVIAQHYAEVIQSLFARS